VAKFYDFENLEKIGISYSYILDSVKTLIRACASVGKNFGFTLDSGSPAANRFWVNSGLLTTVVVSWKMDVHWQGRYQETVIDEVKQAAYMLHWMSKVKPVQLLSSNMPTRYAQLNEICGFWVACAIMGIDPMGVSDRHLNSILYALSYCDVTAEALFAVLEPLRHSAAKPKNTH